MRQLRNAAQPGEELKEVRARIPNEQAEFNSSTFEDAHDNIASEYKYDLCDFCAKSAAGLAAHMISHKNYLSIYLSSVSQKKIWRSFRRLFIRNILDVPNNRDLILTLLKSRCREPGLSLPLYAHVVQSEGRLLFHGYRFLERIDENEVLLDQHMYFEENRLLFEYYSTLTIYYLKLINNEHARLLNCNSTSQHLDYICNSTNQQWDYIDDNIYNTP
ncbi:hypothetical protein BpHYR1_004858 [Brachionus plicatilis]|uniref:Uncharacterized protein n=1 Tax=Brachionus plicatilis TaxID=10195 RepID=A0A3M7SY33_BRAPC|nr:hypothetical protein BpHYR1_004858 [Brachionus plicatilis]